MGLPGESRPVRFEPVEWPPKVQPIPEPEPQPQRETVPEEAPQKEPAEPVPAS